MRGMRLRYIYILQVHSIAMVFVFCFRRICYRYPKVYLVYYKYEEVATEIPSAKKEWQQQQNNKKHSVDI